MQHYIWIWQKAEETTVKRTVIWNSFSYVDLALKNFSGFYFSKTTGLKLLTTFEDRSYQVIWLFQKVLPFQLSSQKLLTLENHSYYCTGVCAYHSSTAALLEETTTHNKFISVYQS